ncbi:DUF1643 domain-containing protein [Actinoplanes sp. OR16]|uniref:DUF1643 domain-containing protein n=1 Tax=Actinoplanes sp. OR16 TaxID=946334 RepID=UPI000FDAEC61
MATSKSQLPVPRLGALLLNPPQGVDHTATISWRNLQVALPIVGCDSMQIANLFTMATRDLLEINKFGVEQQHWLTARPAIKSVVRSCDEILLAWGVGSGFVGRTRQHYQSQVRWALDQIAQAGHEQVWTVLGLPRHPSRWRQFTGPERAIASGANFQDRLETVLRRSYIADVRGLGK